MESRDRFTTRDIAEWLEWRRRNNQQTILLLGSRAGALYRSSLFYEYCQQYLTHNLQTCSRIWSFRQCYDVLLQQQLGEREIHALLQEAIKHVVNLLRMYEEDEYFAEIVKRGYFREIVTLVPLLLRPVSNWKQTPFGGIAPLPREGKKTLSELSSKESDKELSKIADDIHKLVRRLQQGKD